MVGVIIIRTDITDRGDILHGITIGVITAMIMITTIIIILIIGVTTIPMEIIGEKVTTLQRITSAAHLQSDQADCPVHHEVH